MNILVRLEKAKDYRRVEEITKLAFSYPGLFALMILRCSDSCGKKHFRITIQSTGFFCLVKLLKDSPCDSKRMSQKRSLLLNLQFQLLFIIGLTYFIKKSIQPLWLLDRLLALNSIHMQICFRIFQHFME